MSQPSPPAGYLFDRGQGDQDRLIRSSEVLGEFVTEACVRACGRAGVVVVAPRRQGLP